MDPGCKQQNSTGKLGGGGGGGGASMVLLVSNLSDSSLFLMPIVSIPVTSALLVLDVPFL